MLNNKSFFLYAAMLVIACLILMRDIVGAAVPGSILAVTVAIFSALLSKKNMYSFAYFLLPLSVGTPVLATPVGGCVNVVLDGQTGYLAKEVSEQAYISILKRFMDISQEQKLQMRSICIREFEKKYSIKKCAERYVKLFKQ